MGQRPPGGGIVGLEAQAPHRPLVSRRRKRLFLRALLAAGVYLLVATAAAAYPLIKGYLKAREGVAAFETAGAAASALDADSMNTQLMAARSHLIEADGLFGHPATWGLRIVPFVGRQVRTAERLASAGATAAGSGLSVAQAMRARPEKLTGGAIDLGAVRTAAAALREAVPRARSSLALVRGAPASFLLPPLASARETAERRTLDAIRGLERAAAGFELLPDLLGASGARRYLLLFSTLAELRGTGGLFGFYAVVETEDGRITYRGETGRPVEELRLPESVGAQPPEWFKNAYGRFAPTEVWGNLNLSPDFPTVAPLAAAGAEAEIGAVDGVIQLDALGLAPLLALIGPADVEPWPEPVTAENVSEIVHHRAYVHFADDQDARRVFLARLVQTVFDRVLGPEVALSGPPVIQLGAAAAGGHVQVWSARPAEQKQVVRAGVAGAVSRAYEAGDIVGVFTANARGNKTDWFLRRRVELTLRPGFGTTTTDMRLTLDNAAPGAGLPEYVIGSDFDDLPDGTNRQLLTVLRPPDDALVRMDPEPRLAREESLRSYQEHLTAPPGGTASATARFRAPVAATESGRVLSYSLRLMRQPTVHPDEYSVGVVAPRGYVAELRGLPPDWSVEADQVTGLLESDVVLEVVFTQTRRAWLFETLVLRPAAWLESLF